MAIKRQQPQVCCIIQQFVSPRFLVQYCKGFSCQMSLIILMWIIPELSFSQPVLSLLIDSLKNAIRRAKAEINIIYWGKLPSGQRNLKPLRFCPVANAWQMIAMYLQGYGLLRGSDNLQPERVFVPCSRGRWIQMTQTKGGETWTVVGGKFLFKIIFSTADTR